MSRNLVAGVGINDADYKTQEYATINNKQVKIWICPFYQKWISMLYRVYKTREKEKSYEKCSVCDEWLTFSNFKSWMETQDWEGKQLDKDLLDPSNTMYCPEKCIFVDLYINCLFSDNHSRRGNFMLGVDYRHKKKGMVSEYKRPYRACVREYGNRKQIHLGMFTNEFDAHRAWQKAKLDVLDKVKDIYKNDCVALMIIAQRYDKLKYDYDNFLETKSLHHY